MSAPIHNNSVFVVIPVFNESTAIRSVVEGLLPLQHSLIIVDDGSDTNISSALKDIPGIYYLRHRVNLGQGAALQTGINFALEKNAGFIVTFDGDGQHAPKDIAPMLLPLKEQKVDITLASRFLNPGDHNATKSRQFTLRIARLINFFFTGLYLSDAHNGLRAMTREAAEKIKIKENRMAHATEILFSIKKNDLVFKEVPATVIYTDYSRSKGQSIFNSIRIFFDLILHKLFE